MIDGGDIAGAMLFGAFVGIVVTLGCIELAGNMPAQQRSVGHDQGVCDMHCGSHAEVIASGTGQFRCVCKFDKSIRLFERGK